MKITKQERKQLIDRISIIQYDLGHIIKSIDDSSSACSAGAILKNLSVLTDMVNNAEEEQHDVDKEIWF